MIKTIRKFPSLQQEILLVVILLCCSLNINASADSTSLFKVSEIASGIFVHQGSHVDFDHPMHDDIANIGFIIGDECVAVIDTGGSVKTGKSLLSTVRKTTSKPICYVINTHIHFDHLLGNIAFQDTQVKFVGHQDLLDEVTANRAFFLQQFSTDLGKDATQDSIIGPSILVEETMQLDLGNRIIELTAYDSAHSHTDLSVYDEKTKSLWLSDLLFIDRIPALDGNLKNWLKLITEMKQSPAEQIIPGHGPVIINAASAFEDQERYLTTLLSQTRSKIEEGLFMEEIVDQVGSEEKQLWLLYDQHHKRNVTKAFSELEWE
jgi:quinoprotein relay system zinc metallohydrolase 2